MKKIFVSAIALLFLAGCQDTGNVSANGATLSITKIAASGTPVKVSFIYDINADCSSYGESVVRVTTQPIHGKLSVKSTFDFPNFPESNPRHACNTKKVEGKLISYVSDEGYFGTDSLSFDLFYPNGFSRTLNYTISVR